MLEHQITCRVQAVFLLEGNYAYVTSGVSGEDHGNNCDNALSIIDISNPSNPILAGVIHGAGAPNYLRWCK